jgi:hypothetical protein
MFLVVLSLLLQLLCVGCFVLVLVHAFQRSLGTGFMVLCLPIYQFIYGFKQFEHRYKGLVLAGWLGGGLLVVTLRALGVRVAAG